MPFPSKSTLSALGAGGGGGGSVGGSGGGSIVGAGGGGGNGGGGSGSIGIGSGGFPGPLDVVSGMDENRDPFLSSYQVGEKRVFLLFYLHGELNLYVYPALGSAEWGTPSNLSWFIALNALHASLFPITLGTRRLKH